MKFKIIFLILIGLSAKLLAIDVSVYPAVFYEENQGYVEMHYYFSGHTIGWKSVDDSLMQAKAKVLITFSQGDKILKYDKYNLSSPKFFTARDFRDIHRYSLKPGKYQVEIKIEDTANKKNKVTYKTNITIAPPTEVAISDIVILSAHSPSDTNTEYDKYGFYMEAMPYNFVNEHTPSFVVYAEIYNTNKISSDTYSLRLQFEQVEEGKTKPYQGFTKKRKATGKDIYFRKINTKFMPSGNYNLILEVRNSAGLVVAQNSTRFYRDNPLLRTNKPITLADVSKGRGDFVEKLTPKELDYYLTALIPTIDGKELNTLQSYFKQNNLDGKRQFLYSHFIKIDPINPAESFSAFASLAKKVDKKFYSAFGEGFETDRGIIFMRYGAPNDHVKVENEVYALPYEIWVYEDLPNNNAGPIKFLFYNRDRTGENFILLHSNARGERQNKRWKLELFRDDSVSGFDYSDNRIKSREMDDAFNDHPNSMAIRYFQDL